MCCTTEERMTAEDEPDTHLSKTCYPPISNSTTFYYALPAKETGRQR
jgi:hypothetical protein